MSTRRSCYKGDEMMHLPTVWRNVCLRFTKWLAWKLPRSVVRWCTIRLLANATQGKYSNQAVPELSVIDALKRWDDGNV